MRPVLAMGNSNNRGDVGDYFMPLLLTAMESPDHNKVTCKHARKPMKKPDQLCQLSAINLLPHTSSELPQKSGRHRLLVKKSCEKTGSGRKRAI